MIFRLIALGVVAAFRLIRLPCDDALCAVFRQTEADFGILPVKFIQPFFVFLIASAVPAKVVIIAFDVALSMGSMLTWAIVVRRLGSSSFTRAFRSRWFSTSPGFSPAMVISLEIPQKQMEGWL